MDYMRYVGPIRRLRGECALALPADTPGFIKVQFDQAPSAYKHLIYGWHQMFRKDFMFYDPFILDI